MPVYAYDPPERFVAGTIGEPGQRAFYLQATGSGRVTSVALEKGQVSQLAERLDELLDEVLRRTGGSAAIPPVAPEALADDAPLDQPLMEGFRVGTIALAWGGEGAAGAGAGEAGPGGPRAGDRPEAGPALRGETIPAAAARASARRAFQLATAARPPCQLCGLPLDASGHVCPRQNGHRVGRD